LRQYISSYYYIANIATFAKNNYAMTIRVKEICKEKGISLQELADRIGITYNTLHVAITGNPKVDTLERMAAALGVEVGELFPTRKKSESRITCPHCQKEIHITTATP
jgi:DNA-binding Xre family transcriptional regulator